uniref:restriction endonuclease subunit S n=1 Tax=Megasphaera massiliensis TaxID=1232428 RepID=UPI003AF0F3AE
NKDWHLSRYFITSEYANRLSNFKTHAGDIIVSCAGTIVEIYELPKDSEPGIINQALMRVRVNKTLVTNDLYKILFENMIGEFSEKRSNGSAIKNIPPLADLKPMATYIPSKDEQGCVGNFFGNLDHLITLHQRKLDQVKTMKKYFLQNMFPSEGETVPKIRFKGFTGDWEQRKFGEIADYKKGPFGSALKKDLFVPEGSDTVKIYEQQNAINKDWHLARYFITSEYASRLSGFETHAGDIIVSCAGTIGEIYELPKDAEPGIINQALMRVRVNETLVIKDLYKILFANMIGAFSEKMSNGSAIKNIPPFADLKPMITLIPSRDEQVCVANFFVNLEARITLHQRKVDQLQTLKKFMLQNLFV